MDKILFFPFFFSKWVHICRNDRFYCCSCRLNSTGISGWVCSGICKTNEIEPFVKYNYFHKEQKRSFKNNGFLVQNLYYNAHDDYFVCPMGQHMEKTGTTERKTDNGYISKISVYEAKNCQDCPLRCLCHKAKENRRIEVNHNLNRHKHKVRELLNSEEGLLHRSRRPIEPEAVFGQTKSNKHYNRFRHFDKDKVMMDFAIFAIAFNLGKMYRIVKITLE